jgi:transcriptional regulator with XRE-family HTH domain
MKREKRQVNVILGEARRMLGMSQEKFGLAVGSSHRTAVRWDSGRSIPAAHHLHNLARLIHPIDRAFAAEIADAGDETLEGLGLEPLPPPSPVLRLEDLVDLLVLTAVEHSGSTPAAVRPWLRAVMKRGADLGLTMASVEQALRLPPPDEPASKDRKSPK